MTDKVSIKNWAIEDRPREKLMEKGEEALTNAELLAILIGSGNSKQSAVDLMSDILEACDGKLSQLSLMTIDELMTFNGIGEAKAITIKAAAEVGRRRAMENSQSRTQLTNAADTYAIMHPVMQDLDHEEFWVLLLNNQARLIKKVRLSIGGITQTSVDVRHILRAALMANATSMVVCHNHPSGKLAPSSDDRHLTECIKQAAQTMNIRLIDHVIITDGNYYSFADNGKI
jgi:DNA repair protein RadC